MKNSLDSSVLEEIELNNVGVKAPMSNFGVNLSSAPIAVYSSAGGGSRIGKLNVKECFAFTGKKTTISGSEWHQIEFLSTSGWRGGWYKGVNGVSLWRNRPADTRKDECICNAGSFVGTFKFYNVTKTTVIKNGKGENQITLGAGAIVMVNTSDTPSGSTYHHLMRIRAYKQKGGEQLLCCCHHTGEHFGYVDTYINRTSSDPSIRGNW